MGKWIALALSAMLSCGAQATPPPWTSHFVGQMNTAALTCDLASRLSAQADSEALAVTYKTRGTATGDHSGVDEYARKCEASTPQANDAYKQALQIAGENSDRVKAAYAAWEAYVDAIGSSPALVVAQAKMTYQQAVNELYAAVGN